MTDPTLDEAIDKLVMFAGEPDPFGWSLDGENFDLGALVVVVQSQVAVVQHEAWETKQRLKTTEAALDVARASVDELTHVANGLELDVKRWRDQCPVTDEHVKAAGVTWGQALAWVDAHPKDTPELRDVGHHLEHCIRSIEGVAGVINDLADHLTIPAHDILAEMAALEVPT